MKFKKIVSIILGLFVMLSTGTLIYKSLITSNEQISGDKRAVEGISSRRVDATYFHGTNRCYTCTLMEKYIRETLRDNFSEQMKNSTLNFQTINVEESASSHYVQDYKLYTKSFILSLKNKDGEEQWLNCDKIWNLVKDEGMFKKYIKVEVDKYLGML